MDRCAKCAHCIVGNIVSRSFKHFFGLDFINYNFAKCKVYVKVNSNNRVSEAHSAEYDYCSTIRTFIERKDTCSKFEEK